MTHSRLLWSIFLLPLVFCDVAAAQVERQISSTAAEFRGFAAVSETVAWASGSGGTYARTVDGGKSWVSDTVPGARTLFFVDVHAADARRAWLIGTDFNGGYAAIYHTADGGRSWVRQWDKRHAQVFLDGLAFWDASNGIAFSDPVDGSFLILTTRNGGSSWNPIPTDRLPTPLPGEAAFAASGTNIVTLAPGHVWIATGGGAKARVLHSADRGRTWSAYETPLSANETTGIFGIAFRDALNGVAVGGDYKTPQVGGQNIMRTRDGGRTWTVVGSSAPAGVRYGVGYIRGPNPRLIATGPSGFGFSDDEGATWTALDTTGFNTIATHGNIAWLGGLRGGIVKINGAGLARASSTVQQAPTNFSPALVNQPAIRDALTWLDRNFDAQVEEWIRITEIPGTSRHEQRRAAYVRAEMEKEGLQVSTDSIGNVIGVRKGTSTAVPSLVFAAHLDTVHPLDTDIRVKRDGDVLRAPGIFDNSASVANMLAVIRALNRSRIQTQGDLIFIGTAQEELGLNGMEYWLQKNPRPGAVVAMDGGLGSISYGALGIYWTRYSFKGAGSHTNTSAGKPHPARALSDAIRSIYEIKIPEGRGNTVYNVGMLAGGKIFNAIPEEVSFTMDLRSVNPTLLDSLNSEINRRVAAAAAAHKVEWSAEVVTRNPAGGTEEMLRDRRTHPLVQTAVAVHQFLDLPSATVASGSTDSNTAVVRGIPSIAIGRSRGGEQHTLSEWSDIKSALPATKMVLLLAVSMGRLSIVP